MVGQRIGSTIAAVFGSIYVFVNTTPLPAAWGWTLRALAVTASAAVLIAVARSARSAVASSSEESVEPTGSVFGRAYAWVVLVEVLALFAGTRLLSGPLHAPQASVAWVSLVVGTHFFALAVIFAQPFFHWLGAAITACGAAGVLLAFAGAGTGAIGLIAGVVPGALLLAFGWWGALRGPGVGQSPAAS